MTTYDDIWISFVDVCQVHPTTLPQTDEGKYILINNGVRYYNSLIDRNKKQIVCNDMLERINTDLNNDELLLIGYCIKYRFLENELVRYEQVWQPFSSDIGIKFYKDQINARRETLKLTHVEIIRLLNNLDEMTFLGD